MLLPLCQTSHQGCWGTSDQLLIMGWSLIVYKSRFLSSLVAHQRMQHSVAGRSFSSAAPLTWNSLPPALLNCHSLSLSTFKSRLKTHLFSVNCSTYLFHQRLCSRFLRRFKFCNISMAIELLTFQGLKQPSTGVNAFIGYSPAESDNAIIIVEHSLSKHISSNTNRRYTFIRHWLVIWLIG